MTRKLVILGTAAVFAAGLTSTAFAADRYSSPSQPVPYSQLNAYVKASPSKRGAMLAQNSTSSQATPMPATSAGVNTSATTPGTMPSAATSNGAMPNAMPNPSTNTPGANMPAPDAVNTPNAMPAPATTPMTPGAATPSPAPSTSATPTPQ